MEIMFPEAIIASAANFNNDTKWRKLGIKFIMITQLN